MAGNPMARAIGSPSAISRNMRANRTGGDQASSSGPEQVGEDVQDEDRTRRAGSTANGIDMGISSAEEVCSHAVTV